MMRKELFKKLYERLAEADVLNVYDVPEEEMETVVVEIAEQVFRDYLILQGDIAEQKERRRLWLLVTNLVKKYRMNVLN